MNLRIVFLLNYVKFLGQSFDERVKIKYLITTVYMIYFISFTIIYFYVVYAFICLYVCLYVWYQGKQAKVLHTCERRLIYDIPEMKML